MGKRQPFGPRRLRIESLESRNMFAVGYIPAGTTAWNTSQAIVATSPTASPSVTWNNANNDDAVLLASAESMHISGPIVANSVEFTASEVDLNSVVSGDTLAVTSGQVIADSGTVTISADLNGSGGLT